MKKRSLAILAGGMSLALLLSSCGPSSAPTESPSSAPADETGQQTAEEPVTITYCNFNASGGNEETLQKMYEAFHEEHPNITVEIEPSPWMTISPKCKPAWPAARRLTAMS